MMMMMMMMIIIIIIIEFTLLKTWNQRIVIICFSDKHLINNMGKISCFWTLQDRDSIVFTFVGHMVTITYTCVTAACNFGSVYKFSKATVSFFLSICLSVQLSVTLSHATIRLSLGGFSRNFVLNIFIESVETIEIWLKSDKNIGHFNNNNNNNNNNIY